DKLVKCFIGSRDRDACMRSMILLVIGNKGLTATPAAAVVVTLFAQVALIKLVIGDQEVGRIYGVQSHHLLLCDALGLDRSWYTATSAQKSARGIQTP